MLYQIKRNSDLRVTVDNLLDAGGNAVEGATITHYIFASANADVDDALSTITLNDLGGGNYDGTHTVDELTDVFALRKGYVRKVITTYLDTDTEENPFIIVNTLTG